MQVSLLIWILQIVNLTKGLDDPRIWRYRRSSSASTLCPSGCATCSTLNGCLSCKPRLFFHLEMDGVRQKGTCLSSCPRGHYGIRSPHLSTCTRCNKDCASCFSENFCTRCHPGHFLFLGKCEKSCPNGLTANAALKECIECSAGCETCTRRNVCVRCKADRYLHDGQCHLTCPGGFEPDLQLMQCLPQVCCEVGKWTHWGPCIWRGGMQTCRRGAEPWPRHILWLQSISADPCSHVSDNKKCVTKKRLKEIYSLTVDLAKNFLLHNLH